jgi:RNA polymerase sigma-70 factor (ECF subfamily)
MDAALVERAREGDREAFATLARHALPWMDGVARLTLRDPDLARDAVQEALLRAWKGLPGLRDPAQFQAWLRRLVVRSCIDELRRTRGRHAVEVSLTELHSPAILDGTIRRRIATPSSARSGASTRSSDRPSPLLLPRPSRGGGCRGLDMPLGSVKSTLSRSRDALRVALDADARPGAAQRGRRRACVTTLIS